MRLSLKRRKGKSEREEESSEEATKPRCGRTGDGSPAYRKKGPGNGQ